MRASRIALRTIELMEHSKTWLVPFYARLGSHTPCQAVVRQMRKSHIVIAILNLEFPHAVAQLQPTVKARIVNSVNALQPIVGKA